jgi:hypothetical protein
MSDPIQPLSGYADTSRVNTGACRYRSAAKTAFPGSLMVVEILVGCTSLEGQWEVKLLTQQSGSSRNRVANAQIIGFNMLRLSLDWVQHSGR